MKLRNFLYLNTKVIEEYLSAIDGYVYDEEAQVIVNTSENKMVGKAGVKIITGEGSNDDPSWSVYKKR